MNLRNIIFLLFVIIPWVNLQAQSSEDHGYDAVIELNFRVSEDASSTAEPIEDGLEFISLNGHPIRMWVDKDSIIYSRSGSKWLSSTLIGSGKIDFLKVGKNNISLEFVLVDFKNPNKAVALTSGTEQTEVQVYPYNNKKKSRLMCSYTMAIGETGGNCSGTYQVDLKDLSPVKAEKVQEMLEGIKNYSEWLKLLNPADFHILNNFLKENQNSDFENINIEDLKDDPNFQDILALYNSRMSEVAKLKESIYAESGKIREELNSNLATLTEELDRENIDINNPSFFSPEIIPDVEEMEDESELNQEGPSPLARMYTSFSQNMIEQFKISYQNNDRVLLLYQIGSWEKKYLEFDSSLLSSPSPSPQDILALQNSKKMVDAYLYGYLRGYEDKPCIIDLDLWFCDTQIPDDIKELATNTFSRAGEAGEKLNSALRTMNPKTFSPEQAQAYFDSLRILANYFEQFFQNYRTMYEAAKEEQARAAKMLEEAELEARVGLICGAIGLVTSPFFEIVDAVVGQDLCTGKELSNTDRVIKLVGVLVVNDRVLRGIGKITGLTPKVKAVAKWMEEIVESARAEYKIFDKVGIKIYSRIHGAISSLPLKLKPKRIHVGTDPEKIAIIGRSMDDVVDKVAEHFGKNNIKTATFIWKDEVKADFEKVVEAYQKEIGKVGDMTVFLPYERVKTTLAYAENQKWIKKMKEEGFTILDIGDPFNKNKNIGLSAFYDLEKAVVFGDPL